MYGLVEESGLCGREHYAGVYLLIVGCSLEAPSAEGLRHEEVIHNKIVSRVSHASHVLEQMQYMAERYEVQRHVVLSVVLL